MSFAIRLRCAIRRTETVLQVFSSARLSGLQALVGSFERWHDGRRLNLLQLLEASKQGRQLRRRLLGSPVQPLAKAATDLVANCAQMSAAGVNLRLCHRLAPGLSEILRTMSDEPIKCGLCRAELAENGESGVYARRSLVASRKTPPAGATGGAFQRARSRDPLAIVPDKSYDRHSIRP